MSKKTTNYPADIRDFVSDMWFDQNWYTRPEKIDLESALFELVQFENEEIELPAGITPAAYMELWNELCDENAIPAAEEKKKYYLPNENWDGWYGEYNPVCVDYQEADRLCREADDPGWKTYTVDLDWYVADDREIKKYGTYDSDGV